MKFPRIINLFCCLALAATLAACTEQGGETAPAGKTDGINWMEFDEGMAAAAKAGKPVMVDFYTTWCKYCKMLDESTYRDPEIISIINENFVAIKVDAESSDNVTDKGEQKTKSELARSYNVTGYPTIWFFDGDGKPVGPLPGYSPPEDFKPVLTFISSGAYSEGIEYKDYLNSLSGSGAKPSEAGPAGQE